MYKAEYDKHVEQSPPLEDTIIKSFEEQFDKGDLKIFKPEIMHIEPIELFTNEEHTNARMLKAELIEMQKTALSHAMNIKKPILPVKTEGMDDDLNEIVIESQKDDV